MKEEWLPHPGKPPHWLGNQPDRKGASEAQEGEFYNRFVAGRMERDCTDGLSNCPQFLSLRHTPTYAGTCWVLKLRL